MGLRGILIRLPPCAEPLPLLLLYPEQMALGWHGWAMLAQCLAQSQGAQSHAEVLTLEFHEASRLIEAHEAIEAFSAEALELLGIACAEADDEPMPLLLAPLLAASEEVDWALAHAALDLRRARSRGDGWKQGPTLLQQIDSVNPGTVAVASYPPFRSHRIKHVWKDRSAATESLATPRKKHAATAVDAVGPGSLLQFYKLKYGLEACDQQQCILEANDGASVRGYVCHSQWRMPSMSPFLMLPAAEAAEVADRPADRSAGGSGTKPGTKPGPIRLLPEFLVPHPFPSETIEAIRYFRIACCKIRRLASISVLRRRVLALMSLEESVFRRPSMSASTVFPICQHWCPATSRAALILEGEVSTRILQEEVCIEEFCRGIFASSLFPESAAGLAAFDFALDVSTTTSGACEAYDNARLAWFGDSVLLFAATACSSNWGMPWADWKSHVGGLVANERLIAASGSSQLSRFLLTAPFSTAQVSAGGAVSAHRRKAAADALEALLAVLVVFFGLSPALRFLASVLPELTAKPTAFADSAELEASGAVDSQSHARLLGHGLTQLSASAFLLSRYPGLGPGGLTEKRSLLLLPTAPLPMPKGRRPERMPPSERMLHIPSGPALSLLTLACAADPPGSEGAATMASTRGCGAEAVELLEVSSGASFLAGVSLGRIHAALAECWEAMEAESQDRPLADSPLK